MNRLGLLKPAAVACAAVLALTTTSWAQAQKYGVTATVVKNFDATAVKTYTWTPGRPSTDKGIDGQIIAAVDRELAAVGLKPAAAGAPDVFVTYYSVSRTDVDVKAKPDEKGLRPERTVGSLVVALLDPASRKPVVQLRIDRPVERSDIEGSVNTLVTELFTKYPTRDAKKP
jgi:hypothetical protein